MASSAGLDRLGRAMALWLQHRSDPVPSAAEVIAAHPDLADLLAPMFADGADDTPPEPAPDDELADPVVGAVLGDYQVERELARGGMGIVYAARDQRLDRSVALKLLPPGAVLQPRALARFRREAQTAAGLEHPGIVRVFAVGAHAGAPWLAMELIDGERLDHHVAALRRTRRADWLGETVRLVAAVADALEHAHVHGVVHRDVKPSNVLVRASGAPVVTDFGLARSSGLPSLSQTGEFAGTPHYVSPEQVRGVGEVDARSDVFSLGVTLYELLTQRLPFAGTTTRAVLDGILRREPVPPSRVQRALPRALDAVVLKALAKEPRRRYPSAAAFAADLRRFLSHEPVLARVPGVRERLWLWCRREPLRAALGAALALAVAMGGYVYGNGRATSLGNRGLAADRIETMVLQALLGNGTGLARPQKLALLEEIIALGGDDPYAVTIAAEAEMQSGQFDHALQLLDAFAPAGDGPAAIQRLRRLIRARIQGGEPAPSPSPTDALDHYVRGGELMVRFVHGDADAGAAALQHMQRAVALASRPRALFLIGCNQAGRAAGDRVAVHVACDALVFHWPECAASHCFRAMAWSEDDPELARAEAVRSLELAPDNFLGHLVLADLAAAAGNVAEAEAHRARVDALLGGRTRFMTHKSPHPENR